ncbi:hypothetical protein [Bacillus toyonensis]|uniref:hypothetical protein n=1 Tax=Bacillus toyonensis TaxID=155322 RepID=UPI002175AF36|nr:hypothetical protein [Bacillus toyonensis]
MFEKLVGVEPRYEYCSCTTNRTVCKTDWLCLGGGRLRQYVQYIDCRSGDVCGETKKDSCLDVKYC